MNEKLFLVGVTTKYDERWEKLDSLDELASLGRTAGGEIVEKMLQRREKPHPGFFIGKGKAEELAGIAHELDIDTFVFDEELSGTQIRNLEDITGRKVVDRTELILDIFARRANTKAAKVEVELTQLKYRLSRLTGKGITLSRLGGGIGTRGPGEKKLEMDRRKIRKSIGSLEKKLAAVELSKKIQSSRRKNLFRVALVGYTNAGKSTIMNQLTRSKLLVENKLFSTLDSTTRVLPMTGISPAAGLSHRLRRPSPLAEVPKEAGDSQRVPPISASTSKTYQGSNTPQVVLTDTVGFLRKLPHGLITSFRSTLQEAIDADLRLHVVDISHPYCELQLMAGNQILEDLGVAEKPMIYVFNKIDLNNDLVSMFERRYRDAAFISALKKRSVQLLKQKITAFYRDSLNPYNSS
jgi:GTP-binding protein HflX